MKRLIAWISDLRVAIGLLIVIAACSGLGTLVPQKESAELYHRVFDAEPWLGLFNGEQILAGALADPLQLAAPVARPPGGPALDRLSDPAAAQQADPG